MTTQPPIEFGREFSDKLVVHTNLAQEVVVTTVDKVRLCLIENKELMSAKKEWLTPLGIFLTLLPTLVAADFKLFIFKPETWYAMYIIFALGSFAWLVHSCCKAFNNRSKGSIDSIIEELKAQAVQHSEQSQKELQAVDNTAIGKNTLIIKSAKYGAEGKFFDITEILKSKIVKGKLNIVVDNTIAGDPIPEVVKHLVVLYLYNGVGTAKKVSEGEILSLP